MNPPASPLMHAAIRLYLKLSHEEVLRLMDAIGGENTDTLACSENRRTSTTVWFWGKQRWGLAFCEAEYHARELQDKLRKEETCS